MNFKKNTKLITFKESYRGESYVAFAEDKTEPYIFEKFLSWIFCYSHSFAKYFVWDKDNETQILKDFKNCLSLSGASKTFEYGSDKDDIKVVARFYREDKDFLPTDLYKGSRSYSITVALDVTIPSLQDGNILHEDLAHQHYSMGITNLEDVRYLEDY